MDKECDCYGCVTMRKPCINEIYKMNLKTYFRSKKMEIKPEDRDTRDSIKRQIDRLEPVALLPDAPTSVKQEYRDQIEAMRVLVKKLRDEGVEI